MTFDNINKKQNEKMKKNGNYFECLSVCNGGLSILGV